MRLTTRDDERLVLVLALGCALLAAQACGGSSQPAAANLTGPSPIVAPSPAPSPAPHPGQSSIIVLLKLDPRLTSGVYLGDRWLPPPYTAFVDEGRPFVEARAHDRDSLGQLVNISPEWVSADAAIAVTDPPQGHVVRITPRRSGQTTVRLSLGQVSAELSISVIPYGAYRMQVDINQTR